MFFVIHRPANTTFLGCLLCLFHVKCFLSKPTNEVADSKNVFDAWNLHRNLLWSNALTWTGVCSRSPGFGLELESLFWRSISFTWTCINFVAVYLTSCAIYVATKTLYTIVHLLLSAQCVSSIGQIIKPVCVSVSEWVSEWVISDFWDPFHISGTVEARNFKFGMQIGH